MKIFKDRSVSWRELIILFTITSVLVVVRLPGIFTQAPHQDEYFTLLEVAGHWNPDWSDEITTAGQAARILKDSTTLKNITASLHTSVHPPLYYWGLSLWRGRFGYSLEVARGFSLLFSVGAALGFYGLLRAADLKYPWLSTLAYGFSSQAVFWGQNARDYAFASFFVLSAAYFAYRAAQAPTEESNRQVTLTYDLALILSLGLAFASNYFTIFSTAFIFLWYGIYVGSRDLWRVVRSTFLAFLVHVPLLPFVWRQYRIRGGVFSGFPGIYHQIIEMVKANYSVIYSPFFRSVPFMLFVWVVFTSFFVLTVVMLIRRWHSINHKLLGLLGGLSLSPSVGIILVDILFNKNLTQYRYILLVGPGLAFFLTYGLVLLFSVKRSLAVILVGVLFALQFTGINWGVEKMPRFKGSHYRTLAEMIEESSHDPLVIMGSQVGRGHPAVLFDELDPNTKILKLNEEHHPDAVLAEVSRYAMVWFVPATQRGTGQVDQAFLLLLRLQGRYQESKVLVGTETNYIDSRWFERVLRFQRENCE